MLDDHETLLELSRQLGVIRTRIDDTVTKLIGAKDGLTADGLAGVPAVTLADGKGDLFKLCVRLEVALAESAEWAAKLGGRIKELAEADPCVPLDGPGGELGREETGQGEAWMG